MALSFAVRAVFPVSVKGAVFAVAMTVFLEVTRTSCSPAQSRALPQLNIPKSLPVSNTIFLIALPVEIYKLYFQVLVNLFCTALAISKLNILETMEK